MTTLRDSPLLKESRSLTILSLLVAAYIILLWLSPLLIIKQQGLLIYFVAQVAVAFVIGLLTQGTWLAVMLYMSLTGLGISILWSDWRLVAGISLLGFALSTFHLVFSWGWQAMWQSIPTLLIVFAFVMVYVVVFTRQTRALQQVQTLLRELETTHQQLQAYADRVEELTKNQERQRMARELHDTLIQGLAGLILQLEAVDSHLEEGHPEKAQNTAQSAMSLARSTMVEARHTIQALRPAPMDCTNLYHAVAREVEGFESLTGIKVDLHHESGELDLLPETVQDVLRIIQESLVNIHRHAGANHVAVRIAVEDNLLRIAIEDDGIGFEPNQTANQLNAFGIRGMRERAERIGGMLQLLSEPGQGTTIHLEVEMTDDPRIGR